MPVDMMKSGPAPPVAATPGSLHCSPDKPRTASEHRKSSKPIMEKRRRARINESLGQLKTLILDALKKDSSRHSKLEKADILEMTVRHLRGLQRGRLPAAMNTDPSVLSKYQAGFSECMAEVTRFLSTCEGVNTEVRTRLLGHLAGCMTQINAISFSAQAQAPAGGPYSQPMAQISGSAPQGATGPCKLGVPALDSAKVYGGFQIVHASDGQFAFLIPNTAFAHSSPLLYPGTVGVPSAASPGAAPVTTDSVWRPW